MDQRESSPGEATQEVCSEDDDCYGNAAPEAASNLIQLSALKPQPAAMSETLLVMIESRELGPGNAEVYRIQMWHVTVLPLTEAVGSKTPSKKT